MQTDGRDACAAAEKATPVLEFGRQNWGALILIVFFCARARAQNSFRRRFETGRNVSGGNGSDQREGSWRRSAAPAVVRACVRVCVWSVLLLLLLLPLLLFLSAAAL
ncbi:hypothetical protein JDV02_006108 [Purpureocillium takamizusanense]|uniref:Uncharacterized protein n=1 Tax=Purpureocillium takamizusanense TaxID=2060973 RepID=A0A9Q8QJI3_9HYPO|nr:uncharacterized protein JDV02_006108 [Purpureocillium takamizusanense]UNI19966.1 hypothetical protein JDV02_006108 [Purpureocillium takamizusanense]